MAAEYRVGKECIEMMFHEMFTCAYRSRNYRYEEVSPVCSGLAAHVANILIQLEKDDCELNRKFRTEYQGIGAFATTLHCEHVQTLDLDVLNDLGKRIEGVFAPLLVLLQHAES